MLTNEERRVPIYSSETDRPTVPSEVGADTPLENLNLNWRESDLPERIRTKHVHRLHPYLGKFIPQLVEVFLRRYFNGSQTVLDPFVGSGTTLVQANELGIHSIGYDVSAFNVLLCRAKTQAYDLTRVRKEVLGVLEQVRSATQEGYHQLDLFGYEFDVSALPPDSNEYLRQWFAPQALSELAAYRHFLSMGDTCYQDLLKTILCRSARSARLTPHYDLDFPKKPQTEAYWCHKHRRVCQPTSEAFKFLERYSVDTIKRLTEFARVRTDASVTVCHADSRETKFPVVDGILTSPPYVGLIDYHEQHAYAYHLLGLEDRRELEIGSASDGVSQKAKQEYQTNIARIFGNALEAMPTGGCLIVVAADRADLYDDIARMIGVEVEGVIKRHVNRRTGRRSGEFYESVFIWRKA